MKKKTTSITLFTSLATICAIILCAFLSVFVFGVPKKASSAEETVSVWNGDLAAAGWADVEGEDETAAPDTYKLNDTAKTIEIGSAAALAYFSHEVFVDTAHALDGYTVNLTTDIDLDNKIWVPIGSTNRKRAANIRFSGTFDGNGHKIYNFDATEYYNKIKGDGTNFYVDVNGDDTLKIPFENDGGEFAYGIFGVTANMTVKNLTVSKVTFDFLASDPGDPLQFKKVNGKALVPDSVGAIIGYNAGSLVVDKCVSGAENDESVIKVRTDANPAIGGLVGRAYGTKQSGSTTTTTFESVSVTNSKNYVNSQYYAVPNSTSNDDNNGKVSGILGYCTSFKNLTFDNCVNYGNIDGGQMVGGIMGYFADGTKGNVYEDATIRKNNAWVLTINNCVNYGNLTSSDLHTTTVVDGEPNRKYVMGKTFTGGIMGMLECSNDNNKSAHDNSYDNKGKLASVNYYVTNCLNYGEIKTHNTEAKFTSTTTHASYNKGYNAAGGIFGFFMPSETGENRITGNYNYGSISSTGAEGRTYYTPRLGGYIGKLTYYWDTGTTTVNNRKVDLVLTGGSYGTVTGEMVDGEFRKSPHTATEDDNIISIHSLVGDRSPFENKNCNIALIDAKDYKNNISNGTALQGEDASVSIGSGATEIEAGKYLGQSKITEVSFAADSTLTKIGEWAFAGTGLTQINLPASVEEIGQYAFGNDVLVIANDKEHYDALQASDKVSEDAKALLTYKVAVKYTYLDKVLDTVYKLRGKSYDWVLDGDKWTERENVELGTSQSAESAVWYEVGKTTPLTVEAVSELLNGDVETIVLETYTSDKKVFMARTNLVYNGTEYGMTELNSLLQAAGDRVLPTMTASITGYTDSDDEEADAENLPKVVCNAGTYTISVKEGAKDLGTFEIKIARATVDLASYGNLSWKLDTIDGAAANVELLNGNGMTLYMYDKNGSEYPSTTILSDEQIEELGLTNGDYTIKTVMYSVVRNRGKRVVVAVTPNEKYSAGVYADNAASGVGAYRATVVLTANNNYTFTKSSINAQRGLTVDIEGNGKTATVTKKWYVADMSNWLISAGSGDYTIADRVYGETTAVAAPQLQYGNASAISMVLKLNGTPIGNSSFGVADIGKYINSVMPAGSYELVITVEGFNSEEIDEAATTDPENPVMVTVYRSGFTETVSFTVDKAPLPSLTAVNSALKGKTFTYTWDDARHLYDSDAEKVVNAYLATPSLSRANTVWADYNNYYGSFAITFNLASMQSDAYYAAGDTKVDTVDPGKYTVYYRVSAPNYYSSTERLASGEVRQDYFFDVVNIREIEVPEIARAKYTGSPIYPTLIPAALDDEEFYDLLISEDGYVTGGRHSVTLKLRNSDYYCWLGEEVGIDTVVVPFFIDKADNDFTTALSMLGWNFETFDADVNSIRAAVKYLDDGEAIHFRVVKKGEETALSGLTDFTVDGNGRVSKTVAAVLKALKVGEYTLYAKVNATDNYNEYERSVPLAVGKSMNSWADGEGDLVLPGWVVGKYNADENIIVVNPAHGVANITVTDIDGNEYYNSVTGVNKLNDCKVGKYLLTAWVDESTDFAKLDKRTFTIEVFNKIGLPWWGTLLITVGALALAALIIFILWKKGVFQILTEKIVVAIRTRASIDATIASVRAAKKEDEAKKSVAAAEAKERAEARKAAVQAEREKPAEERAAAMEAKAKAQAERAEKMRLRAEAMQARAARMREQAQTTPETPAEQPATETPEAQPATEAAATGPETPETPTEE